MASRQLSMLNAFMWQSPSSPSLVNTAAGLVVAAFVILGLYFTRDFTIPLTAAALLSCSLHPSTIG